MERCSGRVERIFFVSEGFCAGRLRTDAGVLIPFAGPVRLRERDAVQLEGHWVEHPKYGRQFRAEQVQLQEQQAADPQDAAEGLARYLAQHPEIRGVGPVKARQIAERFGSELETVLETEPERVAREIRLTPAHVAQLREVWNRGRGRQRALTELSAYGLTHLQTQTLVEKLGPDALALLRADPYQMLRELPGFGFRRLDDVALRLGAAPDSRGRIRAALLHCLDHALEQGDCWLERPQLEQRSHELLGLPPAESFERIGAELDALLEQEQLARAGRGETALLTLPEIERMERELAACFAGARAPNPHFAGLGAQELEQLVSEASSGQPALPGAAALPALSADQRGALRLALGHSISLLCGGAGTGKTRTVAALADVAAARGLHVVLAAPTGKAAKRLEEVTGREAVTLHRLLGFTGRFYQRGPQDPVAADVLIVDEMSMVNLALAWQLFRSLELRRTALLLVGDPNQLPPIGAGSPLRDLLGARAVPTTVLESVVRQAGVLKVNSLAVLAGEIAPDGGPWRVCGDFVHPLRAQRFVLELFEELLETGTHAAPDIQVLTPLRRGPLGTGELNRALQRLLQQRLFGVTVPPEGDGERPRFLLHDRVIQTRNDYDLGVMNGAIGTVRDADPGGALRVEFEGKRVELEPGSPSHKQLQLGYALTVHKTQGSEFPCALVVVHRSHAFMHHRNLLYTAVTRARERVYLIGDRLALESCARKHRQDERRTLLEDRLRRAAERGGLFGDAPAPGRAGARTP